MTTVKRRQVRSNSNPDSNRPWYVAEINNGLPEITEDFDGALDVDLTGETPNAPGHADLPNPPQAAMASDAIYAVTTDGQFIAYEPGQNLAEHGISLRAHLAWYDSETDKLELLEFVEF